MQYKMKRKPHLFTIESMGYISGMLNSYVLGDSQGYGYSGKQFHTCPEFYVCICHFLPCVNDVSPCTFPPFPSQVYKV